jgi:hypothetical protein
VVLQKKTPPFTGRSGKHWQRRAMKSLRLIEAAGQPDSGAGTRRWLFVGRAGNGLPWLQLKEIRGCRFRCGAGRRRAEHLRRERPAFTKRSGMYRQRRAVKSPRLIEAAGQPDSGAGNQALAFCGQGRQRTALAAAEGDPRLSVPMWRRQESI